MKTKQNTGHIAALFTIVIWATTFISTKVLLTGFQPIEILLFRFVIGFFALIVVYPKPLHLTDRKQEIYFALAGLTGICIYYLMENIALTMTQASNVGVVVSVSPFFIAIFSMIFLKEKLERKGWFFLGFVMAMLGICCISFQGQKLELNPLGDLLSVLAALMWAFYSLIGKKIASFGYNVIQTTRRSFFYGILFMLPTLFFFDFHLDLFRFANPLYLANLLFLGIGASAICFVTWNYAVTSLGPVKTSIYIYLVPVITMLASVVILHEKITWLSIVGIVLTVLGLFLSQGDVLSNLMKKVQYKEKTV